MLVSDTLFRYRLGSMKRGLNPCFSGCWSRTSMDQLTKYVMHIVLILVLVDVGLGRSEGLGRTELR